MQRVAFAWQNLVGTTAHDQAFDLDADIRFRIKHDVPVFNRPFRQVAEEYIAVQQRRAKLGEVGGLRLRRFSDAPLALLIGTSAKRVKEKGAPSLKHPFARAFTALRPFAAGEPKGVQCDVFPPAIEKLGHW